MNSNQGFNSVTVPKHWFWQNFNPCVYILTNIAVGQLYWLIMACHRYIGICFVSYPVLVGALLLLMDLSVDIVHHSVLPDRLEMTDSPAQSHVGLGHIWKTGTILFPLVTTCLSELAWYVCFLKVWDLKKEKGNVYMLLLEERRKSPLHNKIGLLSS